MEHCARVLAEASEESFARRERPSASGGGTAEKVAAAARPCRDKERMQPSRVVRYLELIFSLEGHLRRLADEDDEYMRLARRRRVLPELARFLGAFRTLLTSHLARRTERRSFLEDFFSHSPIRRFHLARPIGFIT